MLKESSILIFHFEASDQTFSQVLRFIIVSRLTWKFLKVKNLIPSLVPHAFMPQYDANFYSYLLQMLVEYINESEWISYN